MKLEVHSISNVDKKRRIQEKIKGYEAAVQAQNRKLLIGSRGPARPMSEVGTRLGQAT